MTSVRVQDVRIISNGIADMEIVFPVSYKERVTILIKWPKNVRSRTNLTIRRTEHG